jgi:hypothetical protein
MSRRKYIIIEAGNLEMPILFSDLQSHAGVAASMTAHAGTVVSAGFWSVNTEGRYTCYGESVSLKIKSRPDADSYLMNQLFNGY